jgi:hypothetical protein
MDCPKDTRIVRGLQAQQEDPKPEVACLRFPPNNPWGNGRHSTALLAVKEKVLWIPFSFG